MTSRLQPYPARKPSGVEWLGDVPAHWEVRRTKTVLKERSQKGFPNEPLLAATQTKGVVRKEQYENRTVLALKDLHLLKLVRVGDFVISLRSFQGGIEYARDQGIISPAYTVVYAAHPEVHAYLAWLFKSPPYIENLTLHVTGIRQGQNIDYSELSRSHLSLPSLPEQAAIVGYLNHADRRIRRYVAAKQKLIALLEEEKQAIVNQAVTRGLDPNVPLKPSGVEWLGDVPAHWGLVGLKLLSRRIQNGSTPSTLEPKYYESGTVPWYGPSSCKLRGQVGVPIRYLTQDAFNAGGARLIKGPALLIVVIGATAGRMALLAENGSTNQQITSFEVNTNLVHPMFVLEQAGCAEHWLRATASTATIPILDADVVCRLPVAVPPLGEQTRIVEHVENFTPGIDNAIARARRQIELVQEYRTRLIADVVTGKLDVREAAAQLPEEAGEAESIDEEAMRPDSMDGDPFEESQPTEEEIAIGREVTV